jgi:hypothetical protein
MAMGGMGWLLIVLLWISPENFLLSTSKKISISAQLVFVGQRQGC